MQDFIKRGDVTIGSIHHGARALGLEVVVETAFPESDPEGDNQFESFERGENHLHAVYEAHCRANGIVPCPNPAKPAEVDAEAAYYAHEAELAAAELAYHEACMAEPPENAETATTTAPAPAPEGPGSAGDGGDDFPF
jgi:hypothetical protein